MRPVVKISPTKADYYFIFWANITVEYIVNSHDCIFCRKHEK